jgi:hypothetical protein
MNGAAAKRGRRAKTVAVAAAAAVGTFALASVSACGSFDDTDAPPADASTTDATARDAAREAEAAAAVSLPTHAALVTLIQNTVTDQISMNGVLYSYFAPNNAAGHQPQLSDIEECLAFQLGALLGNGDVYPPAPLADGYVCRASMMAIHQSLAIPGPIFQEFVAALVVESAVENIVLPVETETQLFGLSPQIVDPDAPDAALPYGWQNAGDGGPDAGDAGDSGTKDAGKDAGHDAGTDSGSGTDAASDAGDASSDSGDSGADAAD